SAEAGCSSSSSSSSSSCSSPPHQHHLQRAPPPHHHHHGQWDNQLDPPLDPHHHPPLDPHHHHHGQWDNQLDPPLDPHHHPPLDPYPDQTQECILVTQQWVMQQQAVAAPKLERYHPPVVYTLGTPALIHKVCKRVRVVPALAPRGQARSPVEVGPEMRLQHMRMDPLDLAAKKSTKLVKYRSSGILCVIVVMLEYRRIYNTYSVTSPNWVAAEYGSESVTS
nr:hypothetical protein [Tanacetum cinerariifolium]